MKRLRKRIASTLMVVSILALNPIGASALTLSSVGASDGWVQTSDIPPFFWYKEGESWATGWKYIDNKWYYLDPDTGYADTGWHCIEGKWYYFQPVRGVLAQSSITPYYYEAEKGIYYLDSNGVYIENPSEEIQEYINLLKNRDLLIKLKIISSETRTAIQMHSSDSPKGTAQTEQDCVIGDDISDNDKDGSLEMYTTSLFGINCTIKYNSGKIYVYDNSNNLISSTDTTTNSNSKSTKNFDYQSGVQVNVNNGQIVAYSGTDTTLSIPSTINGVKVTSIGTMAFGVSNNTLTSITIPNSITSIEEQAFGMCTNLKTITIPSSVTSIGKNAFLGCDNLTFNVENEQTKNLLINSGVSANQIKMK